MLSVNFLFPEITWTADKFRQANAITYLFSRCEGNISLTSKTLKEEFMNACTLVPTVFRWHGKWNSNFISIFGFSFSHDIENQI